MEPHTTHAGFSVQTPAYQGPLELLLDLIEQRKLLVNDIALADVTDEYIQHVRSQASFPMEAVANFIQIAATLLLIKSKSLIPDLTLTEEEQEDIKDLELRLKQYEQIREAARTLSRLFGRQVMLARGEKPTEPIFAPSKDLSPESLASALSDLLAALEKKEKLPEVRVRPMITIEEMMGKLAERVAHTMTLSFKEFSAGAKEKVEVIVSFLALLELVKQGAIDAAQHEQFADIRLTNTQASIPRY